MKRIIPVLLVILICLTGCGKKTTQTPQGSDTEFGYTIDGVKLVPGTDFAAALKALGEADSYSEAASCYFDGMDKSYTYDGFEVRTYPVEGGKDYIQDICITADTYKTAEGITIGSSLDDVIAEYGEDYQLTGSMYRYSQGEKSYTYFFMLNDTVKYFGYAIEASNN